MATDPHAYRRLLWIFHQTKVWYLRVCPFLLSVWMPSTPPSQDPEDISGPVRHDSYFTEVTFKPSKSPGVIQCSLSMQRSFEVFSLMVHAHFQDLVKLSRTDDPAEPGDVTITFSQRHRVPGTRRKDTLTAGSTVGFFLKYAT